VFNDLKDGVTIEYKYYTGA